MNNYVVNSIYKKGEQVLMNRFMVYLILISSAIGVGFFLFGILIGMNIGEHIKTNKMPAKTISQQNYEELFNFIDTE